MDQPEESAAPASPALNADGTIGQDVSCAHCGYNLRGLTADGRCPECNTPIGRSIHGNLLAFADPTWLTTLRRGVRVKLWNILLTVATVLVAIVLQRMSVPGVAMIIVGIPVAAVGLWATFLFTSQEPRISLNEDTVSLRRIVRGCALLAMFEPLRALEDRLSGGPWVVLVVVLGIAMVAGLVQAFGEFVYLRRFARRIPDERLEHSTTAVMWGMVVGLTLVGVGLVVGLALGVPIGGPGGGGGRTGSAVFGVLVPMCLGGVLLLIFGIWNIALLFLYKKAFTDALAADPRLQPPPEAIPPAIPV
ncbi:MAG: hypothetical protein GY778_09225 [bacterium]|nr:hypothetical protein [bacterium]